MPDGNSIGRFESTDSNMWMIVGIISIAIFVISFGLAIYLFVLNRQRIRAHRDAYYKQVKDMNAAKNRNIFHHKKEVGINYIRM